MKYNTSRSQNPSSFKKKVERVFLGFYLDNFAFPKLLSLLYLCKTRVKNFKLVPFLCTHHHMRKNRSFQFREISYADSISKLELDNCWQAQVFHDLVFKNVYKRDLIMKLTKYLSIYLSVLHSDIILVRICRLQSLPETTLRDLCLFLSALCT